MLTARPNTDRATLVRDAVDSMDAIQSGDWNEADIAQLGEPEDILRGFIEYAHYLEALLVMRGVSVPDVRESARRTAAQLAAR